MPRRGLCRCGTVVRFKRRRGGYKGRCPKCGSIVRIHSKTRSVKEESKNPQQAGVLAFHQPASSPPELPSGHTDLVPPDQYNYEALQPGELPIVEMVPLSELPAAFRPSSWKRSWLPLTALLAVAVAIGLMVGLLVQ